MALVPIPEAVIEAGLPADALGLYVVLYAWARRRHVAPANTEIGDALRLGRKPLTRALYDLEEAGLLERTWEGGGRLGRRRVLEVLDVPVVARPFEGHNRCSLKDCHRWAYERPGGRGTGRFCPVDRVRHNRRTGHVYEIEKLAAASKREGRRVDPIAIARAVERDLWGRVMGNDRRVEGVVDVLARIGSPPEHGFSSEADRSGWLGRQAVARGGGSFSEV